MIEWFYHLRLFKLSINILMMNVKFKVKHNKVSIMGSCASNTENPLDHLIKNYGEDAVR